MELIHIHNARRPGELFLPIIALVLMLILSMMQTASAITGQDAAERFNEAGALYRDGRFEEAFEKYNNLIGQNISNPDLLYNAANAAYRSGSVGVAILYLERARKLAPSDEDILVNLAFLNSIKSDQEPVSDNAVVAFIARRYNAINMNAAALWSGISFALAMILFSAALFTDTWKRIVTASAAALLLIIFVSATGILIHKAHRNSTVVEAVILSEEAPAYSGPGTDNTHIFTIHEGTKVIVERTQDDWSLTRLSSGAGGWIRTELMEKI